MKSHRTRYLVELQGYCGLPDPAVAEIDLWLRVAPALCSGWALAATLTQSTTGLTVLAGIALLGAALPWHPFDLPYNLVIRRWSGTAAIPASRLPRRFACGVATIWLAMTAMAMARGLLTMATILGIAFTLVALVPVVTGFCVPSWILRRAGYRGMTVPTTVALWR